MHDDSAAVRLLTPRADASELCLTSLHTFAAAAAGGGLCEGHEDDAAVRLLAPRADAAERVPRRVRGELQLVSEISNCMAGPVEHAVLTLLNESRAKSRVRSRVTSSKRTSLQCISHASGVT